MILRCESSACLRVEGFMKADNPAECLYVVGTSTSYMIYRDILDPLDETCRLLSLSKDTEPVSTAPPPSGSTPSPSAKTAQPQTPAATPTTKTPSSSTRPSSSGDNGDGSSTEGDGSSASPPESGAGSSSAGTRSPTSRTKAPSPSTVSPSSPASSSSSSASSSSAASLNDLLIESTPATTAPRSVQPSASSSTSFRSSRTGLVVGLSVGVVILLVLVALFVVWRRRRRRRKALDDKNTNTTVTSDFSTAREYNENVTRLLDQLNNWKIDSCELADVKMIGSGAQGSVHLVTLDGSRQLASKRLITDQLTKQRLTSFIAEIQLVATLKHPSIVPFVGVAWTTISDLQALFEFMANGDLRTHLDSTKPPKPELWTHHKLKMALQIAEGLVYVHSFNPPIVHRDLKARNILLDADMNAKISDFGVSRFQSEQGTMTTGIGTSRWLAPEVIKGGGRYTEQCDIYSFGVVLSEVDTHDLPFADEKIPEIELLYRVGTGTLRARTSPQCDPQIRELIEQCLCVNPSDRPNALELTFRLRKILKG